MMEASVIQKPETAELGIISMEMDKMNHPDQDPTPQPGPAGPSAEPQTGPAGPSAEPQTGPAGPSAEPQTGPVGPSAEPQTGPDINQQTTGTNPNRQAVFKSKKIVSIAGIIIAILVILLIVNEVGKAKLKSELQRDWMSVYENVLLIAAVFDETECSFYSYSPYTGTDRSATYEYKVISRNQFALSRDDYKTKYTVTFEDDAMIVDPELIKISYWAEFDYEARSMFGIFD